MSRDLTTWSDEQVREMVETYIDFPRFRLQDGPFADLVFEENRRRVTARRAELGLD